MQIKLIVLLKPTKENTLNGKNNFIKAWQLNERHYGSLTGLNKAETKKKIGDEKFNTYRKENLKKPILILGAADRYEMLLREDENGIDTHQLVSFFDFSILPCPPHKRQGFFMIWPLPEQVGQVLSTVKKPC